VEDCKKKTRYFTNPWVWGTDSLDYSKTLPPTEGAVLDCTLGVNPIDLPINIFDALKQFSNANQDILKQYPHDDLLITKIKEGICRKLEKEDAITEDNIVLGCGSLDILNNINLLCLTRGQAVYGHGPQFTAYEDNVNFIGGKYEYYALLRENNYKFDAEEYIKGMSEKHSLFIVENPNNPTGQVIALEGIKKIAEGAKSLGKILIVDEAYGDYMDFFESALNIVSDFENLIVVRTFSKAVGLAGLRLGYAINKSSKTAAGEAGEDSILFQLTKLLNAFDANSLARVLCVKMLELFETNEEGYLGIEKVRAANKKVQKAVEDAYKAPIGLKIAETSDRTPIVTIYIDEPSAAMLADETWSLQDYLFYNFKLRTVGCQTYRGLNRFTVRILLPYSDDAKVDFLAASLADASRKL